MKLEQQVCSLELAKKLKELGVKQESLFYWWTDAHGINKDSAIGCHELFDHKPHNPQGGWKYYSAFTVAELGEMLPAGIVQTDKCKKETDLKEWALYLAGSKYHVFSDNEADARAKMLIYLIENKLQTIPEEK